MAPRPVQVGLAAASALVAILVARQFLEGEGERETFSLVHDEEQERDLFSRSTGSSSNVTGIGPFHLERFDEETARQLFPFPESRSVHDPDLIFKHVANLDRTTTWAEHPEGEWVLKTNEQGFREDGPSRLSEAEFSVLVAGDSHASGACNNRETFSALLEADLMESRGTPSVEVLNAACPGYSFYNYFGTVRRFAQDGPDVVVVTVYGGNDFYGVLKVHHWLRGTTYPPRRKSYWDRVNAAREQSTSFLAQSLNQVLYFQEHPDQAEVALEAALVLAQQTKLLCDEIGARLVYVYVPPAFEVGLPGIEEEVAALTQLLGLEESDLFTSRQIGRSLMDGLDRMGVASLDMGPALRTAGAPTYWERDLHINLRGHEVIAEALSSWIEAPPESGSVRGVPDGSFARSGEGGVVLVEGRYSDGLREGVWIERYPDGSMRSRGSWEGGRRNGQWEWWYDDSTPKKSGVYADEQPDGTWREWYRNGQMRLEARWSGGLPDGEWREWHEGGSLASVGRYREGLEEGTWEILHPDGSLEARLNYRGGVYDGPAEMWHASGALAWKGEYRGGQREGSWEFGREDGAPSARGRFEGGAREGSWTFWRPGGEVDRNRSGRYTAGERVDPQPSGAEEGLDGGR